MRNLFGPMTLRVLGTITYAVLMGCGGGGDGTSATGKAIGAADNSSPASAPAATVSAVAAPATSLPAVSTEGPTQSSPATNPMPPSAAPITSTVPLSAPVIPVTTTGPIESPVTNTAAFGSYLQPYSANSLWNTRPLNPVLDDFVIPKSLYFPTIASGDYSTGIFLAAATDQPMTVVGSASTDSVTAGVADPDNGPSRVITIPRWPAGVVPASGSDGHADIVDPVSNTIHSFWQLKFSNGRWTAALYSWSKLSGTGWGDPAHYYQGARAVGIPASAGLIRKHEINDSLPFYTHALALSLTDNALANGVSSPAYVFPATSADNTASSNTGLIPQGALLMLPASFDSTAIVNADLKKVVETLKLYGAYVVDRNTGTPFVIYVENGTGFNLMPKGWDNTVASQLDMIRASLRRVISAQSWIDGNGHAVSDAMTAQQNMNILSMRGPWSKQSGTASATYDSATQSLLFEATTTKTVQVNASNTGMTPVNWAVPATGTYVKFSVTAISGATLRLQVKSDGVVKFDSMDLSNGQSLRFVWPANAKLTLIATSGINGASSLKAELTPSP